MSHPCDGHPCDHCYLCDVVGICCASVPSGTRQRTLTPDDKLHDAVVDSSGSVVSLAEQIRQASPEPSITQLVREEPAPPTLTERVATEATSPSLQPIKVRQAGQTRSLLPGPPAIDSNHTPLQEVLNGVTARHRA
jgi:hypothetical protein